MLFSFSVNPLDLRTGAFFVIFHHVIISIYWITSSVDDFMNERPTGINLNQLYWMEQPWSLKLKVILILTEIFPSVFSNILDKIEIMLPIFLSPITDYCPCSYKKHLNNSCLRNITQHFFIPTYLQNSQLPKN